MFKRIITAALALIMLSAPVLSVSAAVVDEEPVGAEVSQSETGASNLIYFDATGWKNYTAIYCYVWERGGDPFYAWKQKVTMMKKVKDNLYSFDLSLLESSEALPGGMKDGKDYCVIFASSIASANGPQTYDTTIGKACIGDTAVLTGKQIENPMDSEQTAAEAKWKANSKNYGAHKAITSIGNVVGSVLCPNESGEEVIGDWLPTYYASPHFDVEKKLPELLKAFGVTDVANVYSYIHEQKGDKLSNAEYDEIRKLLQDAYKVLYPDVEPETIPEKPKPYVKEPGNKPGSGGTTGGGTTNGGQSQSGTNRSGASPDGQEDTILFVLGGVMIISAAVVFVTRRKKSE